MHDNDLARPTPEKAPMASQGDKIGTVPLWTEGPWRQHKRGALNVESMTGRGVATCGGYSDGRQDADKLYEESVANAHLIAAAPDLYEALRLTRGLLRDYIVAAGPIEAEDDEVLLIADTAMAKARGAPTDRFENGESG